MTIPVLPHLVGRGKPERLSPPGLGAVPAVAAVQQNCAGCLDAIHAKGAWMCAARRWHDLVLRGDGDRGRRSMWARAAEKEEMATRHGGQDKAREREKNEKKEKEE